VRTLVEEGFRFGSNVCGVGRGLEIGSAQRALTVSSLRNLPTAAERPLTSLRGCVPWPPPWSRFSTGFGAKHSGGRINFRVSCSDTVSLTPQRTHIRIGTKKSQEFLDRLADLRRTEPNNEDARIFPLSYAPVLIAEEGRTVIKPMRYTCRLAGKPADVEKRFPGIYNARRDSLDDYWRTVYGRSHAVMVISGFYENVPEHVYQHRNLAPNEKEKNLVLEFDPKPSRDMLVACLWDHWQQPGKPSLNSFAAITDDPTPEVAATGHQRTIITIQEQYLSEWLSVS
jgi:putative SOS response-associated peptidase YedK